MTSPRNTPLKEAVLLLSFFFCLQVNSQPPLRFTSLVTGLTKPVDIVPEPGSSRLFIVEQDGTIRIVDGTTLLPTPFLNMTGLGILSTGGERGLLSMAFDPNYLSNRYFFVYYTNTAGDITIGRFERNAGNASDAVEASGVVLLSIPKANANHNGGKLNFGTDGMLYFGTGDGGSSNDPPNNAQSATSLLGKMLRLDVDMVGSPYYSIPADNPFVGASPIRDEVFALGLRNPWRWSFDRANGDFWIADVGQGNWEEVNHVTAAVADNGLNYGWRCREGFHPNPSISCAPTGGTVQDPIFEYTHNSTTGGFSITGGYIYRGTNPANSAMAGYYITADYVSGNVWLVDPDGSFTLQDDLPGNISGFGEDNAGELYAVSLSTGALFSVEVDGVLPVSLVRFTGTSFTGRNELKWTTAWEENTQKFIVEYSTNGVDYLVAGEVLSTQRPNGDSYKFDHYLPNTGLIRYRLKMVDIDQSSRFSPIISLGIKPGREIKVYPTIITNSEVQVISGLPVERVIVFTIEGRQVYAKSIGGASGYFNLPLPVLPKGMYLLQLSGKDFKQTEKIIIQ